MDERTQENCPLDMGYFEHFTEPEKSWIVNWVRSARKSAELQGRRSEVRDQVIRGSDERRQLIEAHDIATKYCYDNAAAELQTRINEIEKILVELAIRDDDLKRRALEEAELSER